MTEGEPRREQEQEEPGGTLTTAMKATHGGADRGRSHGGGRDDISRGPTDGGGAGGRGARGGDGEPMSQGNTTQGRKETHVTIDETGQHKRNRLEFNCTDQTRLINETHLKQMIIIHKGNLGQ